MTLAETQTAVGGRGRSGEIVSTEAPCKVSIKRSDGVTMGSRMNIRQCEKAGTLEAMEMVMAELPTV